MFLKKISENSDNSEPWSSKVLLLLRLIVFMSSAWDFDRQSSRPRRYAANLSIPRIHVVFVLKKAYLQGCTKFTAPLLISPLPGTLSLDLKI